MEARWWHLALRSKVGAVTTMSSIVGVVARRAVKMVNEAWCSLGKIA